MIKLIILEGEFPIFNPEVRMFAPFRKILERDKGKKSDRGIYETGDADGRRKAIATKELAFIYWFCDPRSSYVESYQDLQLREEKVKTLLDLPANWKIDEVIKDAVRFYLEEIENDFDVKYLQANIIATENTMKYLENVDYNARDTKGNLLYKPTDVVKTIKEAGGVLESLKTLREKAFRRVSLAAKIRGGGEIGMFESA
jgi:hypothetical protein